MSRGGYSRLESSWNRRASCGIGISGEELRAGSAYQENKREGTSQGVVRVCSCIRRNAGTWGGRCLYPAFDRK
eukprot:gene1838-biopygen1244